MPQRTLVRHDAAQADMAEATAFIRDNFGNEAANHFLDSLEDAFSRLLQLPHLGRPWPTENLNLHGLRRLVLSALPFSVFYRSTETTVEVIRVLHHARHIPPLLEDL